MEGGDGKEHDAEGKALQGVAHGERADCALLEAVRVYHGCGHAKQEPEKQERVHQRVVPEPRLHVGVEVPAERIDHEDGAECRKACHILVSLKPSATLEAAATSTRSKNNSQYWAALPPPSEEFVHACVAFSPPSSAQSCNSTGFAASRRALELMVVVRSPYLEKRREPSNAQRIAFG
mmetsp:Transcript_7084/g.17307  ORF Transcript_7084/g.17307 Transcript_7084/m.17307 type:complete len:178 (-) Transcript_7084:19-552(-)